MGAGPEGFAAAGLLTLTGAPGLTTPLNVGLEESCGATEGLADPLKLFPVILVEFGLPTAPPLIVGLDGAGPAREASTGRGR